MRFLVSCWLGSIVSLFVGVFLDTITPSQDGRYGTVVGYNLGVTFLKTMLRGMQINAHACMIRYAMRLSDAVKRW